MARKKRRKQQPQPQTSPRHEPFHTPFQRLKDAVPSRDVPAAPSPAMPQPVAPSPAAPPPAAHHQTKPAPQQTDDRQEDALFLRAMADVTPLGHDPRGRRGTRQRKPPLSGLQTGNDAALADLRGLVEGRGAFTTQHTDEYTEGVAPGVDQRLAQRLHHGDYAILAQLDLHGHTVDEATELVDRFLTQAFTTGQRCVRLIHGRGKNSPDNRPVLKESVHLWLSQGRLSHLVLAFATAPMHDGGAGATYVLLRRATKS